MSLTVSEDRKWVATGQNGHEPMIFIWDAVTAERRCMLSLPRGARATSAIALSPDGKWLAATDMSDYKSMHIFDIAA
jgi:Tol biopolymer transport system component